MQKLNTKLIVELYSDEFTVTEFCFIENINASEKVKGYSTFWWV